MCKRIQDSVQKWHIELPLARFLYKIHISGTFGKNEINKINNAVQNTKNRHTVLCISVRPRPKRLETRVIIKISTHPCYTRTFDYFSWDSAKIYFFFRKKKSKMADLKKPHFAKRSILNIFLPNWAGWVLGLVGLIDVKGINLAQPMWLWGCPT